MRSKSLLYVLVSCVFLLGTLAFADHDRDRDDHDHGHGRGHYREAHYRYDDHDRREMRTYYNDHYRNLPPGLAKRDRLPTGLERRLRVHYVMDNDMRVANIQSLAAISCW